MKDIQDEREEKREEQCGICGSVLSAGEQGWLQLCFVSRRPPTGSVHADLFVWGVQGFACRK